MKGPRPPQAHMAAYWDASQAVGRPEVTDIIETAIEGVESHFRTFPDLYAHKITQALIKAGIIEAEVVPHLDDIVAAAQAANRTAVVTARYPQYPTIERFDAGSMEVRLFDSDDAAKEWANLNPEWITEVVSITTQ